MLVAVVLAVVVVLVMAAAAAMVVVVLAVLVAFVMAVALDYFDFVSHNVIPNFVSLGTSRISI